MGSEMCIRDRFLCRAGMDVAVHICCCVRTRREGGVERRGEAKTAIPAPLWHGLAYRCCYFFVFVFFVGYTLPCLCHSSAFFCCTPVVLLSYTHCGFVGCWMFFSAACCAVLLLYYVLLLCCCCTGWLGGSVRGCVHGFVFFFFLCNFFSPAIPAPRWHRSAYHWLILIHQRFLHIRREWYSTSLIVNTYV